MRKAIGLLLIALLLVGCRGQSDGETTLQQDEALASQAIDDTVVAEGVIEPSRHSALGFKAYGVVIQVLAEEGQEVQKGDLLVQLDPTDAERAVQQAEVGLQAAQAQLALTKAGARPEEVAAAQAQLTAAEARQAQATAQRDHVTSGARASEIAAAEAPVASAMAEQRRANDTHEKTMECFSFTNPYTGEKQKVCPSLGPREERARFAMESAEEALTAAEAQLTSLKAGPSSDEIRAAEASVQAAAAERQAAQAQLDLTLAGPTDEEIAVAEGEVTRAQAALEAAQAALTQTEVRAPFAGAITAVGVEPGNAVVPGQVACVLATPDQLQVRTVDLSELDVAGIEPGQSATITVDALAERELQGVVRDVALQAEDFRGEAVFPVTVDLVDSRDAPLRWGMTAWVEFGAP